ncbi:unnamed protein product [Closterium sp. NIES-65]|nr:unnamed protein product [Closterium sp. NIES-65]
MSPAPSITSHLLSPPPPLPTTSHHLLSPPSLPTFSPHLLSPPSLPTSSPHLLSPPPLPTSSPHLLSPPPLPTSSPHLLSPPPLPTPSPHLLSPPSLPTFSPHLPPHLLSPPSLPTFSLHLLSPPPLPTSFPHLLSPPPLPTFSPHLLSPPSLPTSLPTFSPHLLSPPPSPPSLPTFSPHLRSPLPPPLPMAEILHFNSHPAFSILEGITEIEPRAVIVDSIQTMHLPGVTGSLGSVSQVRECTLLLLLEAKNRGIPIFIVSQAVSDNSQRYIVGHVTKAGDVAGPRDLKHIVDVVMHVEVSVTVTVSRDLKHVVDVVIRVESDRQDSHRILSTSKNRFGSTDEVGVFEMAAQGMVAVPNPSLAFLPASRTRGSAAVAVVMHGSRPLLLEVQALCVKAIPNIPPTKTANGVDMYRLTILTKIMRHIGLPIGSKDVVVNVVGGMQVKEPAADLAIAVAIASSLYESPVPADTAFIGEIGLNGELRGVIQLDRRVNEVAKLGFSRCVVPAKQWKGQAAPSGLAPAHAADVDLSPAELEAAVRRAVAKVVTRAKAPGALRIVFHDAGTYDLATNTGGMNGSVRFELKRPENDGLKRTIKVTSSLLPLTLPHIISQHPPSQTHPTHLNALSSHVLRASTPCRLMCCVPQRPVVSCAACLNALSSHVLRASTPCRLMCCVPQRPVVSCAACLNALSCRLMCCVPEIVTSLPPPFPLPPRLPSTAPSSPLHRPLVSPPPPPRLPSTAPSSPLHRPLVSPPPPPRLPSTAPSLQWCPGRTSWQWRGHTQWSRVGGRTSLCAWAGAMPGERGAFVGSVNMKALGPDLENRMPAETLNAKEGDFLPSLGPDPKNRMPAETLNAKEAETLNASGPDPENRMPAETLNAKEVVASFKSKGFSLQETVCLLGAHTLGGKGFGDATSFDNAYYSILLTKPWLDTSECMKLCLPALLSLRTVSMHLPVKSMAGNSMADMIGLPSATTEHDWNSMADMIGLPSDKAIVADEDCLVWINKYASNQDLFFRDFVPAYTKMVNSGAVWA